MYIMQTAVGIIVLGITHSEETFDAHLRTGYSCIVPNPKRTMFCNLA